MRKSIKKLGAILLAAAMTVSVAACGNDSQGGSTQTGQSESAKPSDENTDESTDESTKSNDSESAGGEEADREPITITVSTILPERWNDYPDNSVAKYIRDKFGITIEVVDISERKEALLASGDLPDIFIIEANEVVPLIESGFILPLDDLIEKYGAAPYLFPPTKIEEIMDFQRENIFHSDHIYGIMGYSEPQPDSSLGTQQWGLNVDWERYAEVGYPEIEADVDQIYQLLVDMVNVKPTTDDGLPVYAIAYPTIEMRGQSLYHTYSLGYYPVTSYMAVDCKTQEFNMLYTDPESPNWQYNHMYWKLNQDGLLDPDSFLQDFDSDSLKAVNGQYVSTLYHDITGNATAMKATNGIAGGFQMLALKGCTTDSTFAEAEYNMGLGIGNLRCISAKTKYPDRIMEFMTWLFSPEGGRIVTTGVEGETWNYVDGVPTLTEEACQAYMEMNDFYYDSGIGFGWNGSGGGSPDGHRTNLFDEQSFRLKYASAMEKDVAEHFGMTMTEKIYKMHDSGELYDHDFLYASGVAAANTLPDDLQVKLNAIEALMNEEMAACVLAKDEETYFQMRDALIEKVKEMGMDEINEWYVSTYNAAKEAVMNGQ